DTPAVFLMNPVRPWYRDGSLPGGVRIAGPSIETLRRHPRYVDRVHGRGGLVHVWTVDDDVDIDLCVSLGVDAIISNRPGHVLRRLGR
ncbi:MAG TPA: glycerophosphodiester phosphodiesterase, partial [Actinobacteria bacterium]|nr:glycerophosphodiester phosphodiesterase [Actinomycetota bacterium]